MSLNYWENIYKNTEMNEIFDASWLDKYNNIISKSQEDSVLDLGCGSGSESIHILNKGLKVISCDFSQTALDSLKKKDSRISIKRLDLKNKLPFADSCFKIVIASLSLHYFSNYETLNILKEIKRVLKHKGFLICRLNSVNDINYGAGKGIEIEKNYFNLDGNLKRFFSKKDIENYFSSWKLHNYIEQNIQRYQLDKIAWELLAQKL